MRLSPEVFRRAAANILTRKSVYACFAIDRACRGSYKKLVMHYAFFHAFSPKPERRIWWHPDDRESRIFALLLAAEMCKTEQEFIQSFTP